MKAVWQLSLQLWRRMPVLVVLAGGLWIYGMGMLVWSVRGDQALAGIGMSLALFGGWFWHVGQGQLLRGLCRPESFLLPGFRRRLGARPDSWISRIAYAPPRRPHRRETRGRRARRPRKRCAP